MNKEEKLVKMPSYSHHNGINSIVPEVEKFHVSNQLYNKSISFPIHWHDNYLEIQLVLDGSGTEIFNEAEYTMEKGHITILSYTDFHSVDIKEYMKLFKINISYDFLDSDIRAYLTENNNIHCKFTGSDLDYIITLSNKLLKYSEDTDNPISLMAGKAIISTMITETIRQSLKNSDIKKKPRQIQSLIQYINKNLSHELSLETVAAHFGISANYLGKLFKKHVGVSYNEYLNRIRLKYACSLIVSSNISMKEIAHCCGFSSLEYFYYVFKKYNNITPLQYRDKNRK
ncbi:MAG: AraC family transcriptional regulator [Clostridia bacterium]|nr:AraC family transcriptional regulator [Clostridia bacterium]